MKTITIIILLMSTMTVTFAQGKLDKAKEGLSKSSSQESFSNSDDGNSNTHSGGNGILEGLVIEALYFVTYNTFIGEIQPRAFYPHPYAYGQHGEYHNLEMESYGKKSKLMISNTVAVRSDMYGNDLKLNYRFIPVLGLEANHLHFFDNTVENIELGISSIMLNYYRIRENRVTGFWGLGATYVGSDVNTTGFSYNLGLDIYVSNPVSLGLFWKKSFINESSINEFRALGRYHINRFAIHGGFIHYNLGGEQFPSAALGIEFRY